MVFSLMLLLSAPTGQACAYNPETGKVSYSAQATPAYEAKKLDWFTKNETLQYQGGSYRKFGPLWPLAPFEIEAIHEKGEIPIFIDAGNYVDNPDMIYVMASSSECHFQRYELQ